VVRNVVLIRLLPGATDEQVDRFVTALRALPVGGLVSMTIGRDAGLRDGNADVAIVSDFEDEASYRTYDADEEHNRIRRELVAPIAGGVERCQFRL
jgi:hypothetical protein